MSAVEVLVASLGNENNESLYQKMNLATDAVIANQCDEAGYFEFQTGKGLLKIISAKDRGVGKNRNLGILHSSGDILVFSDEDMVYKDGYANIILQAFQTVPKADAIIFDIHNTNPRIKRSMEIKTVQKLNIFNGLKYGAARIAVKREALMQANVWFSLLFGGGAQFCSGEDTLFIRELLKKGLKIYTYPCVVADVYQETSSWFSGYHKQYFLDRGALLQSMFPRAGLLMAAYYSFKYKDRTKEFSARQIFMLLLRGMKNFKNGGINDGLESKRNHSHI